MMLILFVIWLVGTVIFAYWLSDEMMLSPHDVIVALIKDPRGSSLSLFVGFVIAAAWPWHLTYALIDHYINKR